jgi:hypothetical protein
MSALQFIAIRTATEIAILDCWPNLNLTACLNVSSAPLASPPSFDKTASTIRPLSSSSALQFIAIRTATEIAILDCWPNLALTACLDASSVPLASPPSFDKTASTNRPLSSSSALQFIAIRTTTEIAILNCWSKPSSYKADC